MMASEMDTAYPLAERMADLAKMLDGFALQNQNESNRYKSINGHMAGWHGGLSAAYLLAADEIRRRMENAK